MNVVIPQKGVMYHKAVEDARAKVVSDGSGYLEGYVAAFGNVDEGGDRIVRGAFAKTIQERVPAGKVPLMARHWAYGGDAVDAIGKITEAKEDEYGLWIHAEFSSAPSAQEIRTKIQEGILWGLSIGYELIKWQETKEDNRVIVDLLEIKLLEATVTAHPMNEQAVITAAKSLRDEIRAVETRNESSAPDWAGVASQLDALVAALGDLAHASKVTPAEASAGADIRAIAACRLAEMDALIMELDNGGFEK